MKTSVKRRIGIAMWLIPIVVIGLLTFATTMGPKMYKESATVRIHVRPDSGLSGNATMLERYMESERLSMVSESAFSDVLAALHDSSLWYMNADNRLPKPIALMRLSRQVSATRVAGTLDIIELSVLWDNPSDAADIANAIVHTYVQAFEKQGIGSDAMIIQNAVPFSGTRHPSINELRPIYGIAGTISLIGFILFLVTPKSSNQR